MLYATANLEGVAGLRPLARQRPGCQISIEVLEDLKPRSLRVVAEQPVEVFEPCANPARGDAREVHANALLQVGQLDAKSLMSDRTTESV